MDRPCAASLGLRAVSGRPGATAPSPDETIEMIFAKDNAVAEGFNRVDHQWRGLPP